MPKYDVTLTHQLELTTTLTVTAKNAEAAEAKVQQMIDDLIGSPIEWTIAETVLGADWECQIDETMVDEVTEA